MKKAASKRGYNLTSRSRPLTKNDFDQFDLILGMEQKNVDAIEEAAHYWKVPQEKLSKVGLITSYIQKGPYVGVKSIPDPYYGGESGFEKVLDLLEDICEQLYEQVTKD